MIHFVQAEPNINAGQGEPHLSISSLSICVCVCLRSNFALCARPDPHPNAPNPTMAGMPRHCPALPVLTGRQARDGGKMWSETDTVRFLQEWYKLCLEHPMSSRTEVPLPSAFPCQL